MSSLDLKPDHAALAELSRRHRSALLRYFRRRGLRSPDDQDAVQEVFVRLARRSGLARDVAQVDAYLFATAANVAIDRLRQDKVRAVGQHEPYDDNRHARLDHDAEEILGARQTLEAVVIALKELPERTRTIFILVRLEHLKQAEVAFRVGVSINTVEKHLHLALAHLAERIGRQR